MRDVIGNIAGDVPAIIQMDQDQEALKIGAAYRRGNEAHVEVGKMLLAKKAKVTTALGAPRNAWGEWFKANEKLLGFTDGTAARLMRWAKNPKLKPEDVWSHKLKSEVEEPAQAPDEEVASEGSANEDADDDAASTVVIECPRALLQSDIVKKQSLKFLRALKEAQNENKLTDEEVMAICVRAARGLGRGRPPKQRD